MSSSCAVLDSPAGSVTSFEALRSELAASPYWTLRQIGCDLCDGRIVLRGSVTSFYLKQLAVATAARAVGVGRVQIEIDVECNGSGTGLVD